MIERIAAMAREEEFETSGKVVSIDPAVREAVRDEIMGNSRSRKV